jgi:hypothetical protein
MTALRRRMIALLCAVLFAVVLPAHAQPPLGAAELLTDLRRLGSGEMRWFGLKLYDATLWAEGGRFSLDGGFALSLRYARDFEGVRLARASIDEIRRLGEKDEARIARWSAVLSGVFPDVKAGEVITGVKLPDGSARFFHQGRALPAIEERALSDAFFAIWLDPRTREPDLRARLLADAAQYK